MNAITKILAITACSLPLVALAQVLPADQPRTDLERKQTTDTGQATKYGGPGTDTNSMSKSGGSMSKSSSSMSKPGDSMSKSSGSMGKSAPKTDAKSAPATGDVPTYPAPTPDGKPTK